MPALCDFLSVLSEAYLCCYTSDRWGRVRVSCQLSLMLRQLLYCDPQMGKFSDGWMSCAFAAIESCSYKNGHIHRINLHVHFWLIIEKTVQGNRATLTHTIKTRVHVHIKDTPRTKPYMTSDIHVSIEDKVIHDVRCTYTSLKKSYMTSYITCVWIENETPHDVIYTYMYVSLKNEALYDVRYICKSMRSPTWSKICMWFN